MANNNGITRVQALEAAIEVLEDVEFNRDVINVLAHMVEQLGKPKAQVESPEHKRNVKIVQEMHKVCPDSFDWKYVANFAGVEHSQKVVAIMKVGIELHLFEKTKFKNQTLYCRL